jgi:hypothetical protein
MPKTPISAYSAANFSSKQSSSTLVFEQEQEGGYFVQVPVELLKSDICSPTALKLYLVLLSYCGRGETAFPGQARLARDMGLSERRVRIVLGELQEVELLSVAHRAGKTNIYRLHRFRLRGQTATTPEEKLPTKRKKDSAHGRNITSAESHVESHLKESDSNMPEKVVAEPVSDNKSGEEKEATNSSITEVEKELRKAGIKHDVARTLATLATNNGRDSHYINNLRQRVENNPALTNPVGYLVTLVRQNAEPVVPQATAPLGTGKGGAIDWSKYMPGGKYAYLARV